MFFKKVRNTVIFPCFDFFFGNIKKERASLKGFGKILKILHKIKNKSRVAGVRTPLSS